MESKGLLAPVTDAGVMVMNSAVELVASIAESAAPSPTAALAVSSLVQVNAPVPSAIRTSLATSAQRPATSGKKTPIIVTSPGVTTGVITDVKIESTGSSVQADVPLSFGQVFLMGAVATADTLAGLLDSGVQLPLQMDVKATYPDGSVRHAVLSEMLPSVASGQVVTMSLTKASTIAPALLTAPTDLVSAGFSTKVSITVDGQLYTASADELLKTTAAGAWLKGGVANEWLVSAPLRNRSGVPHPHLTARFDVRAYAGLKRAKVDVGIENNWAYEVAPRNFIYDVDVAVGGASVYAKTGLNHYHHARWKKTFWWGGAPQVFVKHNAGYLIATRAVPNYDPTVVPSVSALSSISSTFTGTRTEPMNNGLATAYMPTTGGRADIGLLPGWAVTYLLSMDKNAKSAMMGTADLAGSWSMHYRDKKTDRV